MIQYQNHRIPSFINGTRIPNTGRVMSRKPNVVFSGRFLSVFPDREPIFSSRFFDCPIKTKPKNRLAFFGRFCLQPTSAKKQSKPTGTFSENPPKPTASFLFPFYFRFTWSPHDTNTCTLDPLKRCLFSWFHRKTDREIFGFGVVFFGLQNTPTETDRRFGEKTKKRPRCLSHFRFSVSFLSVYQTS